jgi:DNA-binding CsgD family transcriptional regulator
MADDTPRDTRALQRTPETLHSPTGAEDISTIPQTAHAGAKRKKKQDEIGHRRSTPKTVAMAAARDFSLSRRERDVLVAAARGLYTKEIALHLGLSGKTVEYYWARIFRKLECSSQMEVMALLLRRAAAGCPVR